MTFDEKSSVTEPIHSTDDQAAFTVRNLNFFYGTKKALENVNFDVYPQKVTAMIGSSGCGKSTLLKSLNRIGELESVINIEGKVKFFDAKTCQEYAKRALSQVQIKSW